MSVDTHGLSGAYAVDALTDHERAAFEDHLLVCSECREEALGLRAAAVELTYVSEVAPPGSLKVAVLHRISTVRPLPPVLDVVDRGTVDSAEPAAARPVVGGPAGAGEGERTPVTPLEQHRRRRGPVSWLVAAAAAAILAVAAVGGWHPWDRGGSHVQVSAAEQVLRAKDAERVVKRLPDGATATVVRSKDLGKAVIMTHNLPPVPAGKAYELWLQTPRGDMVPAGMMPRDRAPSQPVLLKGNAASAIGVGITVEPATGSDSPTTPPVAVLKLT